MQKKNIHHWSVLLFDEIDSTNIKAMQMLEDGKDLHRFVISSHIQYGGKGQQNRLWDSPKGNSFSTYILRPAPNAPWNDINRAALLGMLTAVTIGHTLSDFGVPLNDIFYKWPNDILINQHKIVGILPELSLSNKGFMNGIIVGAGVNLKHHPTNINRKTTSILEKYNIVIETEAYLSHYLEKLNKLLDLWVNDGFTPILEEWTKNSHKVGDRLRLRIQDKEIEAYFHEFSDTGHLVVRSLYGEILTIRAGEVFFD
ncbi:MAG: biotin--[acetyl-CoA-carboxylase] ligase [Alphaproteobacteria bacterium]